MIMSKLKRILLIAGRYRAENPYIDLGVKRRFEALGIRVILALPMRSFHEAGFRPEDLADPVFVREGAIPLQNQQDFMRALRGCQVVVFSSWKKQMQLAEVARRYGKVSVDFNASVGFDHFFSGHDLSLVKSDIVLRMFTQEPRRMTRFFLTPNKMVVAGSVLYEDPEDLVSQDGMDNRERFCRFYGFDPDRPVAVLFPKAILGFRKKARLWFSDWSDAQVDDYCQSLRDLQIAICEKVRDSGCNLLVKLHPSSYASYWSRVEEEYEYWNQFPWINILVNTHTHAMFRHLDVGLGINSHSAMDTAYFGKPFIYVDSDLIPPPPLPGFHASDQSCVLPRGPSSHWDQNLSTYPNPWFASWIGWFARREELSALLQDPATYRVDPEQLQRYIDEFWLHNDGLTSRRVVDLVRSEYEQIVAQRSGWASLAGWRGRYQDFLGLFSRRVGAKPFPHA